jgi:hypothetical protein
MVQKCLNCKKEFEAKRETAKYCSANCRVKWNWKLNKGKAKKQEQVTETQLKVLYNAVLEAVGNLPKNVQFQNEVYKVPTPAIFTNPKVAIRRTYDWYKQARIDCGSNEDWAELKAMIEADTFLTEPQIFNLTKKSI